MDIRRLEALLEAPREDLGIEIKGWLDLRNEDDKGNLAGALLALANHGGGFVIVGFEEEKPLWLPKLPRPDYRYDQDLVNGIVKSYAEPTFHCDFSEVTQRSTGNTFPVIFVPRRASD